MRKTFYEAPEVVLLETVVEQGFEGSVIDPWWTKPGDGDFNYDVDTDESWG